MGLVDNLNVRRLHKRANDIRYERGLPPLVLDESACKLAYETAFYGVRTGRNCRDRCQLVAHSRDQFASVLECFELWNADELAWFLSNEPVGFGIVRSARGTFWAVRFGKVEPVPEPPVAKGFWSSVWGFLFGR